MAEREEPVLPNKSVATPSPAPPDVEEASPSIITPDETTIAEGQPLSTLDKAPEETIAAPPLKILVEHPVYFVSTVLRDARE